MYLCVRFCNWVQSSYFLFPCECWPAGVELCIAPLFLFCPLSVALFFNAFHLISDEAELCKKCMSGLCMWWISIIYPLNFGGKYSYLFGLWILLLAHVHVLIVPICCLLYYNWLLPSRNIKFQSYCVVVPFLSLLLDTRYAGYVLSYY